MIAMSFCLHWNVGFGGWWSLLRRAEWGRWISLTAIHYSWAIRTPCSVGVSVCVSICSIQTSININFCHSTIYCFVNVVVVVSLSLSHSPYQNDLFLKVGHNFFFISFRFCDAVAFHCLLQKKNWSFFLLLLFSLSQMERVFFRCFCPTPVGAIKLF